MTVLPDYAVPTHRTAHHVVAPTWREGDWNGLGVDCPFVFRREGRLGMTVVGWDGVGYQTGLAWHDGDRWGDPHLVLARDPGSVHRRHNAALTSILRDASLTGDGELLAVDGWYYATYHAYPDAGYEAGAGVIGIVRSRDLETWEEHGELVRPQEGASWERGGLYKSYLVHAEGRFWLFYNAKDETAGAWVEQTGAAVSDDLVRWTRVSDAPLLPVGGDGERDSRFASDPCVLRAPDGTWIMFYFGLGLGGHACELAATSRDLLTWTKHPGVLVDAGPAGAVDDWHAHKPAVVRTGGLLEHYYCAVQRLEEPVSVGQHVLRERRGIALAWSRLPGGLASA